MKEHLGDRPVTAIIYTHCHIDHFGGAGGIVDSEAASEMPIIAPVGFTEHAVREHINAGVAVSRRSQFMFGNQLSPGTEGRVTTGLGLTLPNGRITLVEPNTLIGRTGQELTVDGVKFRFQLTPGAEAPAEFNFLIVEHSVVCMAETVTHSMHNLYTLRGAQVRDALEWSNYLDEAINLLAQASDIMIISGHWPVWGKQELISHIETHRDLYRYIHDQTLRLSNHVAESLVLPPSLESCWETRGNYGSMSHNIKAVYQKYLGWFDGNPANLAPLPPAYSGPRYVEAFGGIEKVLSAAGEANQKGDYRWAAELLKHAISADPKNERARLMQAEAFDQLGFQSESGPWRNFYLLSAAELRGDAEPRNTFATSNAAMAPGMSTAMLMDFLAIRLNGPKANEKRTMNVFVNGRFGSIYGVTVARGVLRYSDLSCTGDGRFVPSGKH